MSVSANYLRRCAAETGFPAGTLERVVRLGELAADIARHPRLGEALALKGGTPLNLGFGPPHRLSIDLDYNYVARLDLRALGEHRVAIEARHVVVVKVDRQPAGRAESEVEWRSAFERQCLSEPRMAGDVGRQLAQSHDSFKGAGRETGLSGTAPKVVCANAHRPRSGGTRPRGGPDSSAPPVGPRADRAAGKALSSGGAIGGRSRRRPGPRTSADAVPGPTRWPPTAWLCRSGPGSRARAPDRTSGRPPSTAGALRCRLRGPACGGPRRGSAQDPRPPVSCLGVRPCAYRGGGPDRCARPEDRQETRSLPSQARDAHDGEPCRRS